MSQAQLKTTQPQAIEMNAVNAASLPVNVNETQSHQGHAHKTSRLRGGGAAKDCFLGFFECFMCFECCKGCCECFADIICCPCEMCC